MTNFRKEAKDIVKNHIGNNVYYGRAVDLLDAYEEKLKQCEFLLATYFMLDTRQPKIIKEYFDKAQLEVK